MVNCVYELLNNRFNYCYIIFNPISVSQVVFYINLLARMYNIFVYEHELKGEFDDSISKRLQPITATTYFIRG